MSIQAVGSARMLEVKAGVRQEEYLSTASTVLCSDQSNTRRMALFQHVLTNYMSKNMLVQHVMTNHMRENVL